MGKEYEEAIASLQKLLRYFLSVQLLVCLCVHIWDAWDGRIEKNSKMLVGLIVHAVRRQS